MTPDPISRAVAWLIETPARARPHPVLPHLKQVFGLSTTDAIAAIRQAQQQLARSS